MKIVCVGGGPAGLYFAALARLRLPSAEVTVIERNPPGVTYGWGVVFGEHLLAGMQQADPVSARRIAESAVRWRDQHVRVADRDPVHLGGTGYAIGRHHLLDLLAARARELGVRIEYERELDPDAADAAVEAELAHADLVIACDGVHSRLRRRDEAAFGTRIRTGGNRYLWLGTHALFDAFTFAFEQTPAGWIWFHGYRYDADTSTVVVECAPHTWEGLGFAELDPAATSARLSSIFARHLGGHTMLERARDPQTTAWLRFTGITNERWSNGSLVLMGDAAHTAHFSIGSGTTLALDDAIVLADCLAACADPRDPDERARALDAYRATRLPDVIELQTEAANSERWFESVDRTIASESPLDFGYALLRRRFAHLTPGEHSPRWRYEVFRATQHAALRSVRFRVAALRRVRPRATPLR